MTPDAILAFVLVGYFINTYLLLMLLTRAPRTKRKSWYTRYVERVWGEE